VKRREFITLLGGAAAAWPLAARAQQRERMRRIGVLMGGAGSDPVEQARLMAFLDGLQQLGWTDGRNVRIDTRWPAGNADRYRTYAAELVELAPDVILASASASVAALQQASRSAPIVFAAITDPVGSGFVASLPRPGGNMTGVMNYEYSVIGKWLAMLKEIAPSLVRAAFVANPKTATRTRRHGVISDFRMDICSFLLSPSFNADNDAPPGALCTVSVTLLAAGIGLVCDGDVAL
jgi:putative tryptophan/tyrosine transport system substrate-binding protein